MNVQHRTSNIEHRMDKKMNRQIYDLEKRLLIKKPELLDGILEETEELIKIFVTSIKTAEKKQK